MSHMGHADPLGPSEPQAHAGGCSLTAHPLTPLLWARRPPRPRDPYFLTLPCNSALSLLRVRRMMWGEAGEAMGLVTLPVMGHHEAVRHPL